MLTGQGRRNRPNEVLSLFRELDTWSLMSPPFWVFCLLVRLLGSLDFRKMDTLYMSMLINSDSVSMWKQLWLMFGRKVVLRDIQRFHHFEDGKMFLWGFWWPWPQKQPYSFVDSSSLISRWVSNLSPCRHKVQSLLFKTFLVKSTWNKFILISDSCILQRSQYCMQ